MERRDRNSGLAFLLRWALHIVAALGIIGIVTVATLWAVSEIKPVCWHFETRRGPMAAMIFVSHGQFYCKSIVLRDLNPLWVDDALKFAARPYIVVNDYILRRLESEIPNGRFRLPRRVWAASKSVRLYTPFSTPVLSSRYWIELPLWIPLVISIAATGFGLVRPVSVARRVRARCLRGECIECGYDLTGNTSGVCPECGTACKASV